MNPEECKFTKEHEWVYVEDGDTAIIGISDYAAGELGDIVYIPRSGTRSRRWIRWERSRPSRPSPISIRR